MGMDYIAVFAGEQEDDPASANQIKISTEKVDDQKKQRVFIQAGDLSVHPSNKKANSTAGAYQLTYNHWKDAIDSNGWPRTFDEKMQDRVAIYLLQSTPTPEVRESIRRSALGYIMEGKIKDAVDMPSLTKMYPFLPGGAKEEIDVSALEAKFKKYIEDETSIFKGIFW